MKRLNSWFAVLSLSASLLGLSASAGLAADKWAPGEAAVAAAQKYFLHLGFSAIPYDENGVVSTPAGQIPGSNIRLDPSYTLNLEAGYFFTPNFALALSSGYPPTVTAWGAGSIANYAGLGKVTGGIMELNAQYHFRDFGAFQPYVGAGPAYFHVFDTKDGTLSQFSVSDAFGFNVQVGADWMMSEHFGLFADLKKVFISTTSSGFAPGPVPINADVRLDPTIISVGMTFRY